MDTAAQIRGETVSVAEVGAFWKGKLKAFRNRILAVPTRVREGWYLDAVTPKIAHHLSEGGVLAPDRRDVATPTRNAPNTCLAHSQ
jgi:hypothetical protein